MRGFALFVGLALMCYLTSASSVSKVTAVANRSQKQQAIDLKLKGLTYREIGKAMGFSRQYAQHLVRPPQAIYDLVKKRAKGQCEQCSVSLENGHVHHRIADAQDDYNDVDNLLYLCASCHQAVHTPDRPRRPELWLKPASCKLPKAMGNKIDQMAKEQHVTGSAMIRILIEQALEARAKKDKK